MLVPQTDVIVCRILAFAAMALVLVAVAIAVMTPDTSDAPMNRELVASAADRVRLAAATSSSAFWLVLVAAVVSRLHGSADDTTRVLLRTAVVAVMVVSGAGTVAAVFDDAGRFFVPVAYQYISIGMGAVYAALGGVLLWWMRSENLASVELPEPIELEP